MNSNQGADKLPEQWRPSDSRGDNPASQKMVNEAQDGLREKSKSPFTFDPEASRALEEEGIIPELSITPDNDRGDAAKSKNQAGDTDPSGDKGDGKSGKKNKGAGSTGGDKGSHGDAKPNDGDGHKGGGSDDQQPGNKGDAGNTDPSEKNVEGGSESREDTGDGADGTTPEGESEPDENKLDISFDRLNEGLMTWSMRPNVSPVPDDIFAQIRDSIIGAGMESFEGLEPQEKSEKIAQTRQNGTRLAESGNDLIEEGEFLKEKKGQLLESIGNTLDKSEKAEQGPLDYIQAREALVQAELEYRQALQDKEEGLIDNETLKEAKRKLNKAKNGVDRDTVRELIDMDVEELQAEARLLDQSEKLLEQLSGKLDGVLNLLSKDGILLEVNESIDKRSEELIRAGDQQIEIAYQYFKLADQAEGVSNGYEIPEIPEGEIPAGFLEEAKQRTLQAQLALEANERRQELIETQQEVNDLQAGYWVLDDEGRQEAETQMEEIQAKIESQASEEDLTWLRSLNPAELANVQSELAEEYGRNFVRYRDELNNEREIETRMNSSSDDSGQASWWDFFSPDDPFGLQAAA